MKAEVPFYVMGRRRRTRRFTPGVHLRHGGGWQGLGLKLEISRQALKMYGVSKFLRGEIHTLAGRNGDGALIYQDGALDDVEMAVVSVAVNGSPSLEIGGSCEGENGRFEGEASV